MLIARVQEKMTLNAAYCTDTTKTGVLAVDFAAETASAINQLAFRLLCEADRLGRSGLYRSPAAR
jgi:hypothetical protein